MHYKVKECGHVSANKSSSLGRPLGSRATMTQTSDASCDVLLKEYCCIFWYVPLPLTQFSVALYAHCVNYDSLRCRPQVTCRSMRHALHGSKNPYPAIAPD